MYRNYVWALNEHKEVKRAGRIGEERHVYINTRCVYTHMAGIQDQCLCPLRIYPCGFALQIAKICSNLIHERPRLESLEALARSCFVLQQQAHVLCIPCYTVLCAVVAAEASELDIHETRCCAVWPKRRASSFAMFGRTLKWVTSFAI